MSSEDAGQRHAAMSLHEYPDGSFDGVAYVRRGRSASGRSWWAVLDQEEKDSENRARSARRASRTLQRHVRYGNLTRLLTFTNGDQGGGWQTRREAMATFSDWYRREGRQLLGQTGVVVVAERGKRHGRWHLHAAIRRGYRLDYSAIIASWSAHLEASGWRSGSGTHRFHAGDELGRHSHGFKSARVCARYMAKYVSKGFDDDQLLKGQHRYESDGCAIPEPKRTAGFRLGEVPGLVSDTFGAICTPFLDGRGQLAGYWFDSEPPPGLRPGRAERDAAKGA